MTSSGRSRPTRKVARCESRSYCAGFITANLTIKVTYIFKLLLDGIDQGPGFISLMNGHEIPFGKGSDSARLGGPLPVLCNLRYAVARVLRMSGAVEVIMQLIDDADESDFSHIYLASTDFCDILSAKLLLSSGRDIQASHSIF